MRNLTNKLMLQDYVSVALLSCLYSGAPLPSVQAAPANQPLVTVGGQTITNQQYTANVNAAVSKEVLRKMVFTSLVRQAAVKAGVMPTESDVDVRIRELSGRQPALAQQAATPSGRADMKSLMALENLRIKNVTVTDAQVTTYYNANKSLFTLPSQVQTTMVVSQNQAASVRAEAFLKQNLSPQAIAVKPGLHVAGVNGFNVNMQALPPAVTKKVGQTVLAMKSGQVKTIPVTNGYFLTFKVKSAHGSVLLPLSQVKAQVSRQLRLQKAVSAKVELAKLYQANPPHFNDPKIKSYFTDIEHFHPRP